MNRSDTENGTSERAGRPIDRLLAIMARLRGPDGCPWDREQTPASLRSYLLEEAFEAAEAIDSGDPARLREELGDLLLQVVFLAQIAAEAGQYDFDSVAEGIADKLTRRHPHVFESERADSAEEAWKSWDAVKRSEKKALGARASRLDGVPTALPALLRAVKLSHRAARSGFDWPDVEGVERKVDEELAELRSAITTGDRGSIEEELGDLLFAGASLARKLDVDPEAALQRANAKFARRFRHLETDAERDGVSIEESSLDELERRWQAIKRRE